MAERKQDLLTGDAFTDLVRVIAELQERVTVLEDLVEAGVNGVS